MDTPNLTLLVVDDDPGIRAALRRWALNAGLGPHLASSAQEAVAILEDRVVDVVLMDLRLPDDDGMALARRLISENPERPVVVMTAYAHLDSAREAIEAGASDYVTKPIDFDRLALTIGRAVDRRRALVDNRIRQTERLALAYARLEDQDRLLIAYQRIAEIVMSTLDRESIVDSLAVEVLEAGIFRSLSVSLVDARAQRVELVRGLLRSPDGKLTRFPTVEGITYPLTSPMVIAEVAREGEIVLIDSADDQRLDPEVERLGEWTDKVAYFIPVKRGNDVLAVLATASTGAEREGLLSRIEAMRPLLSQVAIALHNADLYQAVQRSSEALREKERLLTACNNIARIALSSLNMNEILDSVGRQIVESGIFRSLMVALVDEDSQSVEVVRSFAHSKAHGGVIDTDSVLLSTSPVVGIRYALDDTNITAEVARTGEMRIIESADDPRLDRRVDRYPDHWRDKVAYFIPVKTEERVLAVLATGSPRARHKDVLRSIETIEPMFSQVAIALDHARLYRSVKDYANALGKINLVLEKEIADRKRAEQALVRLERLGALGEMSAGINHNLNNILTGVLGPAEMVSILTKDPRILQEAALIRTSALRARDLVMRLHHSVRGEEERPQPVRLNDVVKEAVGAARPRWKDQPESRGVTVKVETDLGAVPLIRGTPSGLHDALLNLLFNAVDALPEGGTIRISTRKSELGARLLVADDGIGMTGEVRRRVFEPFFTTKANVGTGLGLSTVYGTVTRWGGHIDVESEPGRGATFILDLPAWKGDAPAPADAPAARDTRPGRLLLVEDEETVRDVVSRMLSRIHCVDVAASGDEALARFQRGCYDVALIDLGMPGMPGDRLAEALRAVDPAIATVLLTGWSLGDDDARTEPFDFRIQKPVTDVGRVQDVVAQAIQKHDERAGPPPRGR